VVVAEHRPRVETLMTENDPPINKLFSAKPQRLLVESRTLMGLVEGRSCLVEANLALSYAAHRSPLVSDVILPGRTL
jgi:hypothetical protein